MKTFPRRLTPPRLSAKMHGMAPFEIPGPAADLSRPPLPVETLCAWVCDARRRTLDLVADLADDRLMGPRLDVINPLLWEVGHLAWFQEKWVLRRDGRPSLRADADALYDSAAVAHDTRWDLPLPTRTDTLRYMQAAQERVLDWLQR